MLNTLIDLRGFVMRSYFSGKDPDGIYDSTLEKTINTCEYGYDVFIERYLSTWLEQGEPHRLILCLEGGNAFRTKLYEDYKGNRGVGQSVIEKKQIYMLQEKVETLLKGMGLTMAKQDGAEADDLIAYLAINLEGRKLVHTVDKDLAVLASLADTTVCYHSTKHGNQYYSDEVDGLPAKFLTLQKSLVGDSSDNYKGVKGFGQKTWEAVIEDYGIAGLKELERYIKHRKFDELLADATELDDKRFHKIHEQREEWMLSYTLAKLYPSLCNSVTGRTLNKIQWIKNVPDAAVYQSIIDQFEGYEATNLIGLMRELKPEYVLVTAENLEQYQKEFLEYLPTSPVVGWDYETYDPHKYEAFKIASKNKNFVDVLSSEITGCSFAVGRFNTKVYYVSCFHKDTDNTDKSTILEWIKQCESSGIEMVAQNSQFEAAVSLTNFNHKIQWMTDTAMFAKNLYEEEPAGLKGLTKTHLDYTQTTYAEVVGDREGMHELTGEEVLSYGCDDAIVTAHLLHLFWIQSELEGTKKFITEYDCESLHLLVDSFVKGCGIDMGRLKGLADKDAVEEKAKMRQVRELLQLNCSQPNPEAANALYTDIRSYHRKALKHKGKSGEEITKKLAELEQECLEQSQYSDLKEFRKEVEFIPTPTKITAVLDAEKLDLKLTSVSAKAITELLIEAEINGVSHEVLTALAKCAGKQIKDRDGADYEVFRALCAEILKMAANPITVGTELNFDSPKQMMYLLYAMLGLPIRTRTKVTNGSLRDELGVDGGPSGNEKAMQIAAAEDCQGDLEWKRDILLSVIDVNKCRTRNKLYWTPYPLWCHPRDGNMHPQIKQSATVTNRPTGTSPNLLQVSKKDGGHVRSVFTAGEGYAYVSIDFSGQELRITASETKDPVMLDAYIGDNPKDLHSVTACAIAKPMIERLYRDTDMSKIIWDGNVVNYEFFRAIIGKDDSSDPIFNVFKKVRAAAKTLNFGVVYGAGPTGIAMQLMIPIEVARSLIDALFSRYERLPLWKEEVYEFARKHGYVETAFGSRKHCWPDIVSRDSNLRSSMERKVANFKIQGCLQPHVRVTTDRGLIPISKLSGKIFKAWTGFAWKDATAFSMGAAQYARITLKTGHVIECDVRHKLKGVDNEWVEFGDLQVGHQVALSEFRSGGIAAEESKIGWPFVVGFWLGDGSLCVREISKNQTRKTLTIVGGATKEGSLRSIHKFLESEGVTANFNIRDRSATGRQPLFEVTVHAKDSIEITESHGINGEKALEKRVPEWVWEATEEAQREFLSGYLLADGTRKNSRRVHTPNKALLNQLQELYEGLSISSHMRETSTGFYLEMNPIKGGTFPLPKLLEDLDGLVPAGATSERPDDYCEDIVDRRVCQGRIEKPSSKVVSRIYRRLLPDKELYRYSKVASIEVLEDSGETFTLEVDDPLHQFVAGGVVHKNCAADVLKISMANAKEERIFEETGATMLAPIYDEIAARVPIPEIPTYCKEMSRIMAVDIPNHQVPQVPEVSIGLDNWGYQRELGAYPSDDRILEALQGES